MSAKVEIKTKGVRGGEFSTIKETALVVAFIDGTDFISIDSFQGAGNTYKRSDESEIEIKIADLRFKGSASDLYRLLAKQ